MHRRLWRLPRHTGQAAGRREVVAAGAPRACSASVAAAAAAPAAGKSSNSKYSGKALLAVGVVGVAAGVAIGDKDSRLRSLTVPNNSLRACCEVPLTESQKEVTAKLEGIVGSGNVKKNYYQKGSRLGAGTALAHVSPGTLQETIDVLKACVAADVAVLPQGANTSLTGAAVPRDSDCDRPTVVINMRRLKKIMPVGKEGHQVLCYSGAGIFDLKDLLASEYNRDSHSVLGSLFLNPSVGAGIAYGSGGTQIRKGPAYTDRALYLRVCKDGSIELVNTLGLKDGGDAVAFLEGKTSLDTSDLDPNCKLPASWPDYATNVRTLTGEVARYNADTRGEDCKRSEGKVMILASIHDTFPMPKRSRTFWISCKDMESVNAIKTQVALKSEICMAQSCEYMNRNTHNGVDSAGRLLVHVINIVGMKRVEPLWNLKLFVESIPLPFTNIICDKFLWWFNNLGPHPLPQPLRELGRLYDHHLLVQFSEYSDGEIERLQCELDKFVEQQPRGAVKYHMCHGSEESMAQLWRFVVAPAFRTYVIGRGMQGLSIDFAMPKNAKARPVLPEEQYPIAERWTYSHFGCNVYHEDLVFGNEVNVHEAKHVIKHAIEEAGGKLPAEHGHGTEYKAPSDTQQRWKKMDPLNVMNPGVGGMSNYKNYAAQPCHLGCAAH
eukprot:TRINITY_DN14781_c0_g1_i1.p1 TRINITY_DN14781_c0_g1~~TRINITY_DN14781_c0_g1_i1.p1  ORF type:complete len:663 (+),score=158.98 TRINITY_DN14781_c0_g1_i1:125-2113(+)